METVCRADLIRSACVMGDGGNGVRWLQRRSHRVTAREGYALWADNYPPWAHNPLMQAEQGVVVPMLRAAMPKRALDNRHRHRASGSAALNRRRAADRRRGPVMAMLGHNRAGAPRVCGDGCRLPFAMGDSIWCAPRDGGDVEDLGGWLREAAARPRAGGTSHLLGFSTRRGPAMDCRRTFPRGRWPPVRAALLPMRWTITSRISSRRPSTSGPFVERG